MIILLYPFSTFIHRAHCFSIFFIMSLKRSSFNPYGKTLNTSPSLSSHLFKIPVGVGFSQVKSKKSSSLIFLLIRILSFLSTLESRLNESSNHFFKSIRSGSFIFIKTLYGWKTMAVNKKLFSVLAITGFEDFQHHQLNIIIFHLNQKFRICQGTHL